MTRLVVRTFALLIGAVVLSICFLSSRLLNGVNKNRRVHLNPRLFGGAQRHSSHFDDQEERHVEEEWNQEFILKRDLPQPHRPQEAEVAPRNLDIPSEISPDSEDDHANENKESQRPQEIPKHELVVKVPDVVSVSGHRICAPEKSVAMIKTHKCSSSTLQNIILRKAEDLNLTVAIPREGVYLGSPDFFRRGYILGDTGRTKYNVMASHMRFRTPRDVQQVMAPGAKYITILRNPPEQFESMYTYYGWESRFHADMQTFLDNPDRLFRIFEPRRTRNAGQNPMCFDNGLDTRMLSAGSHRLDSTIKVLSEWYDLVLIAEYFEESLILLKELMCWSLDDIVFFNQNARNKESVVPLSPRDRAAIRRWNWADAELYDHFNATLWAKIDLYGRERMAKDVAQLRAKNKVLADDCIGQVLKSGDRRVWYPEGIKINSFILNEDATYRRLCEQLVRPELMYLKFFREKIKKSPEYIRIFGGHLPDGHRYPRRIDNRGQVRRRWIGHPV